MQKDFHYDVVYALAKQAGYKEEEASVIAHSSQYVDDNTDREYSVFDSHGEFYIGFPDISIKDLNSYWFGFQNAAKKQLSMVLSVIPSI